MQILAIWTIKIDNQIYKKIRKWSRWNYKSSIYFFLLKRNKTKKHKNLKEEFLIDTNKYRW